MRARGRLKPWLREVAFLGCLAGGILATRSSLADHYLVPSGSMLPSVSIGDHVLVDKTAYGVRIPFTGLRVLPIGSPKRGEVVVLESPVDGVTLLKRVVAVPGDLVEVKGGAVYVRGERVDQPATALGLEKGGGPDYGPVALGEDEYLVLGDHRGDSFDGRGFGPVRATSIFGRVRAVIYHEGRPVWHGL